MIEPIQIWPLPGSAEEASLKGMSGGGIWQVSLGREIQVAQLPALAAMIVERPQTYQTAILATRAPLIRSFIRKFDTNA